MGRNRNRRLSPVSASEPSPGPGMRPAGINVVWDRIVLGVVLLWTFLLGCTEMRSTDIWWHVRTGQMILERGQVPWIDWYTYTDWDNAWIDLHWLFQIVVALLYGWGGVRLLVLAKAACLALSVAIGWLASGSGLPRWAKALLWVLPIVCLSGRALVRPEMVTLVCLALWLWIMFGIAERPGRIWWLPVIQLVWTNSHGLFVLGPVVGAAYLVDRAWRSATGDRFSPRQQPDKLSPQLLLAAVAVTGLVSLVNPYVEEGALYPLVLFGELSDPGPTENLPPIYFIRNLGFANVFLLAELGVWLMTTASFLWLAIQKRFDLMRLLLFAGFSYLAWRAQRNTNIFALVSGVVCCLNVADSLRLHTAQRQQETPKRSSLSAERPVGWWLPNPATQLVCGLLVAWCGAVVTNLWSEFNREGVRFGLGERAAYYIHEPARFAGRDGMPKTALIAQFGQAGVYIFHNAPERKVYLDGRLNVISPETERSYFEILELIAIGNRQWEERVRDSAGNLPVVILDSRHARPQINGLFSDPSWRMVFADQSGAVFVETRIAERLELEAADPAPLEDPPR